MVQVDPSKTRVVEKVGWGKCLGMTPCMLGYFSNAFHRQRSQGITTPAEENIGNPLVMPFLSRSTPMVRYFVWRHRFPPGKEGKQREYEKPCSVQCCAVKQASRLSPICAVASQALCSITCAIGCGWCASHAGCMSRVSVPWVTSALMAVDQLPAAQATALRLTILEGLSLRAAPEQLQISAMSVSHREVRLAAQRAKKKALEPLRPSRRVPAHERLFPFALPQLSP